ncbi:MAG TPA: YncE family protein [Ktedonobacteraceae bacterium]
MMRFVSNRWFLTLTLLFIFSLLSLYFAPHISADGGAPNLAYVSGTSSGVSVIDVGQAKVTKTISVAGDPHTILLSQDGGLLYVSQPALGQVSVVRASTGRIFCTAHLPGDPSLLAIDPDLNTLYAAGNGSAQVTALDPTNCKILHTFGVNGPVYGLAVALTAGSSINGSTSNQLWVASTDGLTIFDDMTHQTLGAVPLPNGPQYLSIPPGETVYVTTRQGSVDAVSLKTREVRQILNGGNFGPMDYDALTGEVYVPDKQHNVLNVLSPVDTSMTTFPTEPERVIHTDATPESVAITSDGLLGFIALQGGRVAMLDLIAHRLVYTVGVGGMPLFIITGLYPPPVVLDTPTPISNAISSQQTTIPQMFWVIVFSASLVTVIIVTMILVWQLRQSLKAEHKR